MADSKPSWPGRLLDELQGPSSLGMGLSGGAVGFSASILNPDSYAGFWTSVAFQMHAGFQLLSVAFGVLFVICRLKNNDMSLRIDGERREDAASGNVEQLQNHSRRLASFTRSAIYAQISFLFAGAIAFIWLMLLHFQHALYP